MSDCLISLLTTWSFFVLILEGTKKDASLEQNNPLCSVSMPAYICNVKCKVLVLTLNIFELIQIFVSKILKLAYQLQMLFALMPLETRHALIDATFERGFAYNHSCDLISSICKGKVGVFQPTKEKKKRIFVLLDLASGDPEKILQSRKSVISNAPRGKGERVNLIKMVEMKGGLCVLETAVVSRRGKRKTYFETMLWDSEEELPRALVSWFGIPADSKLSR